jgi:hypothetical protein
MNQTDIKDIATLIGVVLSLTAILWGIYVYSRNSRLERAKWLERLYERFYESPSLKEMREIIDCNDEDGQVRIKELVRRQPAEFTDYLNFFEFVAILESNGQLRLDEVKDLFHYYLKCLHSNTDVREYIQAPENGFEKLNSLFAKL